MKTKNLTCIIAFFAATVLVFFTTASCTKEKTIIVKIDTLVNDSLLSSVSWEIAEAIGVMGNTPLRYERGGNSNNWNVAGDYYVFNKDKTGYMYDGVGSRHQILNWNLLKTNERVKLVMEYQNDPALSYTSFITWDNLIYKNGGLHYSDYYRDAITGANYHGQAIRVPKKSAISIKE